jgi:hypothetical protein
MPVNEVLARDRPELAGGEEPCDRGLRQRLPRRADVVTRLVEHPLASPVATEQQPAGRLRRRIRDGCEHLFQVLRRRFGVADVELDGLARARQVGDGHGPALLVDAHHVANHEVAAGESLAVFADGPADEQAVAHQRALPFVDLVEGLLQRGQRRAPAELLDDVVAGLGDHKSLAHRPAPLRDDRFDRQRPRERDADHSVGDDLVADEQRVAAGLARGRGHAADQGKAGECRVEPRQDLAHGGGEGVAQRDQGPGFASDAEPLGQRFFVFQQPPPLIAGDAKRMCPDSRQNAGQNCDARGSLHFLIIADDPLGADADEAIGRQAVAHAAQQILRLVQVIGREKDADQIRRGPDPTGHVGDQHFSRGGGDRVLIDR